MSNVKINKKSIGIIIFNKALNKVLMIQKKCTYSYMEFIFGKYDKNNQQALLEKFNKMTVQEKLIISSFEFEWMWYYAFMTKEKNDNYCKAFGKFYKNFITNPKLLKMILNNSHKSGSLLWEPPKGRKNKNESSLSCAIREVYEETRHPHKSYQIIPSKRIKKQFIVDSVRYIIIYYFAIMTVSESINYDVYNNIQSSEVSNIKWVLINKLDNFYIINDIKQLIKKSNEEIKREYKGVKYNKLIGDKMD